MFRLLVIGCAVGCAFWMVGWPSVPSPTPKVPSPEPVAPSPEPSHPSAGTNLVKDTGTHGKPRTLPLSEELKQACGPLAAEVRKSLDQFDADTMLHKNHTLLVLGLDAAYRNQVMLGQLKSDLTDEQQCQASWIVDRYQRQFDQLLACRTRLLQSSASREKVDELLRFNRIATVLLTRKVHQRIFIEVLTREQKTEIANRRNSQQQITR